MVITVILDAALEQTLHVPGLALGEDCRAERSQLRLGGRGLAAASAVRSLGGQGAAVGVAGGAEGEYIRDKLDLMGLPNDLVLGRSRTPTNLRLVDGDRVTRVRAEAPAASEQELAEVWQKVSDLAKPGDAVLLTGEPPRTLSPERLSGWIAQLRREGIQAVWNLEASQRYEGTPPTLLIAGPAALSALCGARLAGRDALLGAAKRAVTGGTEGVVIPSGSGEVLFVRADGALRVQAGRPLAEPALTARILIGLDTGEGWETLAVKAVAAAAAGKQPPEPGDLLPLEAQMEVEQLS